MGRRIGIFKRLDIVVEEVYDLVEEIAAARRKLQAVERPGSWSQVVEKVERMADIRSVYDMKGRKLGGRAFLR